MAGLTRPRERDAAARRARAAARQRRRRRLILVAAIGSVVAALAALLLVNAVVDGGTTAPPAARRPLPPGVLGAVAGVPRDTLDRVGLGAVTSVPRRVADQPLTSNGKPQVLYIGAEYCPYCAAQRWPLVQALSRFGTFHALTATRSASNDVYPDTATFSFYGATYTSGYLAFDARELFTNTMVGNRYQPLQTLERSHVVLFARHGGAFPFVDLGGRFVLVGASYEPDVLRKLSVEQIAASLSDPASPVARGVDGSANVITAALCELTQGRPAAVCTAPGVVKAADVVRG